MLDKEDEEMYLRNFYAYRVYRCIFSKGNWETKKILHLTLERRNLFYPKNPHFYVFLHHTLHAQTAY